MTLQDINITLSQKAREVLEKAYHSTDSDKLTEGNIKAVYVEIRRYTGQSKWLLQDPACYDVDFPKDRNGQPVLYMEVMAYPTGRAGRDCCFSRFLEELTNALKGVLSDELDVNPALPECFGEGFIMLRVVKFDPSVPLPSYPVFYVHDICEYKDTESRRIFSISSTIISGCKSGPRTNNTLPESNESPQGLHDSAHKDSQQEPFSSWGLAAKLSETAYMYFKNLYATKKDRHFILREFGSLKVNLTPCTPDRTSTGTLADSDVLVMVSVDYLKTTDNLPLLEINSKCLLPSLSDEMAKGYRPSLRLQDLINGLLQTFKEVLSDILDEFPDPSNLLERFDAITLHVTHFSDAIDVPPPESLTAYVESEDSQKLLRIVTVVQPPNGTVSEGDTKE